MLSNGHLLCLITTRRHTITSTKTDLDGQLGLRHPLNWTEYARWVNDSTDERAGYHPIIYALSGLATEGGECGAFVEKYLRYGGDPFFLTPEVKHKIMLEAGDVLYYLQKLANDLGVTLEEFRDKNVIKLEDRKLNGKR